MDVLPELLDVECIVVLEHLDDVLLLESLDVEVVEVIWPDCLMVMLW